MALRVKTPIYSTPWTKGKNASGLGLFLLILDWIYPTPPWRIIHPRPDAVDATTREQALKEMSAFPPKRRMPNPVNLNQLHQLDPVNLSSTSMDANQVKLLRKGSSFCPTPKDINWQSVYDGLKVFEARLRPTAFFIDSNPDDTQENGRIQNFGDQPLKIQIVQKFYLSGQEWYPINSPKETSSFSNCCVSVGLRLHRVKKNFFLFFFFFSGWCIIHYFHWFIVCLHCE